VRYEFLLRGRISETVRAAFPELEAADAPTGGTALFGPIRDKAHLRGLLARFDELGLTVIEMRQLPD